MERIFKPSWVRAGQEPPSSSRTLNRAKTRLLRLPKTEVDDDSQLAISKDSSPSVPSRPASPDFSASPNQL